MPPAGYGAHAAAQAAGLSVYRTLRAALRPFGVRGATPYSGPTDTPAFDALPPPRLAPAAIARAVLRAPVEGLEEVPEGDVATDLGERLLLNPNAVERELAPD